MFGLFICVSEISFTSKFPQTFLLFHLMNSSKAFSPIRERLHRYHLEMQAQEVLAILSCKLGGFCKSTLSVQKQEAMGQVSAPYQRAVFLGSWCLIWYPTDFPGLGCNPSKEEGVTEAEGAMDSNSQGAWPPSDPVLPRPPFINGIFFYPVIF